MLLDVGGGGSKCFGRPTFFKFIILLFIPIDSGVRQLSHHLMIPLDCLWAKLNSRTRR